MAPPSVDVQRGQRAQRVVWSVLSLAFLALAAGGPVQMIQAQRAASPDRPPGTVTIRMAGLAFRPEVLAVGKGTEILFVNDDVTVHTVNGAGGGPVDSGALAPGKGYKLVINETLDFVCLIHPSMRGRIVLTG